MISSKTSFAALTIFISINADSQLLKQYTDSLKKYSDQKNTEQTIFYLDKTIKELEKDSAETLTLVRYYYRLGNTYLDIDQYKNAELSYLKAKDIIKTLPGNYDAYYASICNNLGITNEKMARYDLSLSFHFEALKIRSNFQPLKAHPAYLVSCNNIAVTYVRMSRYDQAEPFYVEAMTAREKKQKTDEEKYDFAVSCNNLGALYMDMGLYEKAKPLFFKAGELWSVNGKYNSDYSMACSNLALLYLYMGQYKESEQYFLGAIEIEDSLKLRNTIGFAITCDNFSILYREIVQYEKAEKLLLESKQIKEKIVGIDHPEMAGTYNNLGGLYSLMRRYDESETFYLKALKIREKIPGKLSSEYALSCNDIGSFYADRGQLQKAEPFFLEALKIRKKTLGEIHFEYSISCRNLGCLYRDMNQYKKAEDFFIKAKTARAVALGTSHPFYANLCYEMAALYRNMNNRHDAKLLYEEAAESNKAQLKNFFSFTSEAEKQTYIYKNLQNENALLSFFAVDHSNAHQGFTYNISLRNRNMILSSSMRMREILLNSGDTAIINKFNNWSDFKKELAYWYSKPVTIRPPYIKDLEEKANVAEKKLTLLSEDFKKEQSDKDVDWKFIQQRLQPNEAAIEFIALNYSTGKRWADSIIYIALLLRKDKPGPILTRLFEKRKLDAMFDNLNRMEHISEKMNNLYHHDASLYDIIWKPLEKYLKGISTVYFAPAGDLFKLSFAALPISEKLTLSDKYRLVQLNTTATVLDNSPTFLSHSDKMQLYGGIQYDTDPIALKESVKPYYTRNESIRSLSFEINRNDSLIYLPATEKEINEIKMSGIKKGFSVYLSSGVNATEESIKALNGTTSPTVLHIATHGFFFADPGNDPKEEQVKFAEKGKVFKQSDNPLFRSGLILAGANHAWVGKPIEGIEDGILTAYEVSNLYFPNTRLVVLSACETALGDIQGSEGVYGLQRAFKMAGVQNLVMSLWQIGDRETAEFMQLFYNNLFDKQSINDAFYNAQTVMKKTYRNEPYKWAAWVLIR